VKNDRNFPNNELDITVRYNEQGTYQLINTSIS